MLEPGTSRANIHPDFVLNTTTDAPQGDKTHTLVPGTAQSKPSSSKQEEDKTVGRTMAKFTQKHSPAPSLQPHRNTTRVPASSHGSSASATASLRSNPESEPRGIESKADPVTGGDTARTDHRDRKSVRQTINMTVLGGTGGSGGPGEHGGHGGTDISMKLNYNPSRTSSPTT
ncbi:hypothetical protein MSAN_00154500 [Mycena sanguinolenta]|uniref:Uncharacterized protein n=1 Tax=Mycena sanguinolenta TaxID=230812 RepID=A0A8H7DN59_9AGAR|nr:hypothetical protein MSAN_00154500 [Mycena sanguinolenta]